MHIRILRINFFEQLVQAGDHAVQMPGRNQPERIPAVNRQANGADALPHVEYAPRAASGPNFNYYHEGKNSPERKDYIMDKLVVPVEE